MKTKLLLLITFALCLAGCNAQKKKMDTPSTEAQEMGKDKKADFAAFGNEPFWNLEITFGETMTFKSLNEPAELTMPVPPANSKDGSTLQFNVGTEDGAIQVTILREDCQDSMSGEAFTHRVRVAVKDNKMDGFEQINGCGRYQGHYRLNDAWALISIDGKAIDSANFPNEMPNLELQLVTRKVLGFAGCNRFSGALEFTAESISFGALISTKMACPQLDVEDRLMRALSMQSFDYQFSDTELTLQSDDHTLVFGKIKQ